MSITRQLSKLAAAVSGGAYDGAFGILYPGREPSGPRNRYLGLIKLFEETYLTGAGVENAQTGAKSTKTGADGRVALVSAPGRAEVCGNHTDHQHGNVLAAAVDQDNICVAATNDCNRIRVKSAGHPGMIDVSLDEMDINPDEQGTDTALIRGIAAWFINHGAKLGGFDAYTTSNVPIGSGLSSSASFEVVIGTAINTLFNAGFKPLDIAIAGQYSENNYFGKPCGLMDQTASSVGGFVRIDFNDPKNPVVEPIQYDPASSGLRLCVVNTKGSHADLIGEYASIPDEMRAVAACFDKGFLRDVDEDEFYADIPAIRDKLSAAPAPSSPGSQIQQSGNHIAADRAILRTIHFLNENRLVQEAAAALKTADAGLFLDCINRSGKSSFCYLQNIYAPAHPGEQGLSLALALSESILSGNGGAWRVHGGGFAGTIMAFVPVALYDKYINTLGSVFGADSCITLSIRKYGGIEVTPDVK